MEKNGTIDVALNNLWATEVKDTRWNTFFVAMDLRLVKKRIRISRQFSTCVRQIDELVITIY